MVDGCNITCGIGVIAVELGTSMTATKSIRRYQWISTRRLRIALIDTRDSSLVDTRILILISIGASAVELGTSMTVSESIRRYRWISTRRLRIALVDTCTWISIRVSIVESRPNMPTVTKSIHRY